MTTINVVNGKFFSEEMHDAVVIVDKMHNAVVIVDVDAGSFALMADDALLNMTHNTCAGASTCMYECGGYMGLLVDVW